MIQTTILEKVTNVFSLFFSSWLPILFGTIIYFLYYLRSRNYECSKKQKLGIYGILVAIILILYHDSILSGLDYIATNILTLYYFPDLAIYYLVIIISHVIFLISILSKRWPKKLKTVSLVQFLWFEMLFTLFLYTVAENNLDVSDMLALYQNVTILPMLEFTILTGVIFALILGITAFLEKDNFKIKYVSVVEKPDLKSLEEQVSKEEQGMDLELHLNMITQKKELLKLYRDVLKLSLTKDYQNQEEVMDNIKLLEDTVLGRNQMIQNNTNMLKQISHEHYDRVINQIHHL